MEGGKDMSTVLKNQVDTAEKSAEALEEALLQIHHRQAMLCMDVQDLVRTTTNLFQQVGQAVDDWQAACPTASADERAEIQGFGGRWHELYVSLATTFQKTSGLIRALEDWRFSVKGKRAFLDAWKELRGIVALSPDRVAASVEQFNGGRFRTLGAIRDELRDNPV